MRLGFHQRGRLLWIAASVVVLFVLASCGGNSNIVGKWRMSGAENIVWEFLSNGSVVQGDVQGRYKFGDQDRIKIQTPFATTVYVFQLSGDQLVLQETGGSKLEFTRVSEKR